MFDLSAIMPAISNFFGGGAGAGLNTPALTLGGATLPAAGSSAAASGPGFGLGQQLVQGGVGDASFAQAPIDWEKLSQLGGLGAQLLNQANQQPAAPGIMPVQMGGRPVQTMAQNGYLAQGGGMGRTLVNGRGY